MEIENFKPLSLIKRFTRELEPEPQPTETAPPAEVKARLVDDRSQVPPGLARLLEAAHEPKPVGPEPVLPPIGRPILPRPVGPEPVLPPILKRPIDPLPGRHIHHFRRPPKHHPVDPPVPGPIKLPVIAPPVTGPLGPVKPIDNSPDDLQAMLASAKRVVSINQSVAVENITQRLADLASRPGADGLAVDVTSGVLNFLKSYRLPDDLTTLKPGATRNDAIMQQNEVQHIADRIAQLNQLVGDLGVPSKRAEAAARIVELEAAITNPQLPDPLTGQSSTGAPADPNQDMVNRAARGLIINQSIATQNVMQRLGDLAANGEHGPAEEVAKGLLSFLTSYRLPADVTTVKPGATRNEAILQQNRLQRMADEFGQLNNLIGALSNPTKFNAAVTRLQQLEQAIRNPI